MIKKLFRDHGRALCAALTVATLPFSGPLAQMADDPHTDRASGRILTAAETKLPPYHGADVSLCLALVIDSSGSIEGDNNAKELESPYALQIRGTAEAMASPEVRSAIKKSGTGKIAVIAIEYSHYISDLMPWQILDGKKANDIWAMTLSAHARKVRGPTNTAFAVGIAIKEVWKCQQQTGARAVVDVSSDGIADDKENFAFMKRFAEKEFIAINGLPIHPRPYAMIPTPTIEELVVHFQEYVITTNGFIEVADDFKNFTQAMRKKLVTEISGIKPPAQYAASPPHKHYAAHVPAFLGPR